MRHLRILVRQPAWVAVALAQPIIWLLVFGALFKKVVEIPGFQGRDYIGFLTPGVVMMTAFFTGGWGGFPMLEDLTEGVTDRFLATPVKRGSLILGRVIQQGLQCLFQSAIIVGLALLDNAHFPGGVRGVVILVVISAILGGTFNALSVWFAIVSREQESLAAALNFFLLPLTFISTAFLQKNLVPDWIRTLSRFNPLNWAVEAGREAVSKAHPDWGLIGSRTGYVVAFALFVGFVATRAFNTYQRSV
jgi:ABC-2 type transport system permease protein